MADKKLTDVDVVSSADDSDSLILIKGGVAKAVRQIAISSLNLGGETSGAIVAVELQKNGDKVQWRAKMEDGQFSSWKDLFNLTDVKGNPGDPGKDGTSPVISIGTVETVENNVPAAVTKTGTNASPIFNFKIPKGKNGDGSGDVTSEMLNAAIKTNVTDKNFLQSSTAESTYLKKSDATSTYQTVSGMTDYLKKQDASSTYQKISEMESYVTDTELNEKGYITQTSADSRYISASKESGFLTSTQASNTYVSKTNVPFVFQKITQSNYDSLGSKDSNTVYLIVG